MTENITVNTHSSIRIDADGTIIRIDPFGITGMPRDADIILITHEHYDHFSPEDIERVKKPDTIFAAPAGMQKKLAGIGADAPVLLSPGERTEIKGIPVEAVASYNLLKPFHPKSKGWLGYIVTAGGKRIYAAGDTDATDEVKAVRCDIAMIPVGGTYTMNVRTAATLVNEMRPEIAIPVHYGSIAGSPRDGAEFAKLIDSGISVEIKLK